MRKLNSYSIGEPVSITTIAFTNIATTGNPTVNGKALVEGDIILASANTPPQAFVIPAGGGAWTADLLLSVFPVYTQFLVTAGDLVNQVYIRQPDNTLGSSTGVIATDIGVVYVTEVGDDLNSGLSLEQSKATIQDGFGVTPSGAQLQIYPKGVAGYAAGLFVNQPHLGTEVLAIGDNVTVQGDLTFDGGSSAISSVSITGAYWNNLDTFCSDNNLDNLYFRNGAFNNINIECRNTSTTGMSTGFTFDGVKIVGDINSLVAGFAYQTTAITMTFNNCVWENGGVGKSINLNGDKITYVFNNCSGVPTTINYANGATSANVVINLGDLVVSNIVTTNTVQTITGQKTFTAPILGAATADSLAIGCPLVSNSKLTVGTTTDSIVFIDVISGDGAGGTQKKFSLRAESTNAFLNTQNGADLLFGVSPASQTTTIGMFLDSTHKLTIIGSLITPLINKLTLTTPATGAVLTLANNSSLITSGAFASTLTFTGTTNVTFPTSGTLAVLASTPVNNEILLSDSLGQPKVSGVSITTSSAANDNITVMTSAATTSAIAAAVISAKSFRGGYDASTNLYPVTGGSGAAGAVEAGDLWSITVAGTLGGDPVVPGDTILALVDTPGQTAGNWYNNHDAVYSVFGRQGNVTAQTGDYAIAQIGNLGTNVATFLTTPSSANLASALTDKTGTGVNVFATSPTLVTPTLGVATATSINKVAITAPATSSTLTIADGKTLTANASIILAGTDSSQLSLAGNLTTSGAFASTFTMSASTAVTFPTTGTLATLAGSEALTNKTINSLTITSSTGTLTIANAKTATVNNTVTFSGTDGSTVNFGFGGTIVYAFSSILLENKTIALDSTLFTTAADQSKQMTFNISALSGSAKVFSFPNYSATIATVDGTETLTNKTLGITNTVTLLDTLFTLQDNTTPTKQLQFELSSITAATTRTITIPDSSGTMLTTGFTTATPQFASLGINNAAVAGQQLTIYGNSTTSATIYVSGNQNTAISTNALYLGNNFAPTASIGTAYTIFSNSNFGPATSMTITSASTLVTSPTMNGAGTVTTLYGAWHQGGAYVTGTVTNHYTLRVEAPNFGTNRGTIYADAGVSVGATLIAGSTASITASTAYNLRLAGTQTAQASNTQHGLFINSTFAPAGNLTDKMTALALIPTFTPTGGTTANAMVNFSDYAISGSGTITNLYMNYSAAGGGSGPTITNAYNHRMIAPTVGTTNYTLHADTGVGIGVANSTTSGKALAVVGGTLTDTLTTSGAVGIGGAIVGGQTLTITALASGTGNGILINSSGIGGSTPLYIAGYGIGIGFGSIYQQANDSNGLVIIDFRNTAGGGIGNIYYDSGLAHVVYGVVSDRRLKENIKPATNALSDLMDVKFYNLNYTASEGKVPVYSLLADDLETTKLSYLVNGKKTAMREKGVIAPQQVDYMGLIPVIGAAVQDINTRLLALEAKIA